MMNSKRRVNKFRFNPVEINSKSTVENAEENSSRCVILYSFVHISMQTANNQYKWFQSIYPIALKIQFTVQMEKKSLQP